MRWGVSGAVIVSSRKLQSMHLHHARRSTRSDAMDTHSRVTTYYDHHLLTRVLTVTSRSSALSADTHGNGNKFKRVCYIWDFGGERENNEVHVGDFRGNFHECLWGITIEGQNESWGSRPMPLINVVFTLDNSSFTSSILLSTHISGDASLASMRIFRECWGPSFRTTRIVVVRKLYVPSLFLQYSSSSCCRVDANSS